MLIRQKVLGTISYMAQWATPEKFTWSLLNAVQFTNEALCQHNERIALDHAIGSGQDAERNALAGRMEGDWLLQLDCDHEFEPDLIYRMVTLFNRHDLDVLTGLYQWKNPPHLPVIYQAEGPAYKHIIPAKDSAACWTAGVKMFRVDCAGAGCLLVHRRVFDRIATELREPPFNREPPFSEDFTFFNRLRKLNIEVWCAPAMRAHHLQIRPVDMDDFDAELVSGGEVLNVAAQA